MKRFMLVLILALCLTVPLMFLSGCEKKEKAAPEPEQKTEEIEEAPVDTAAVSDTTEMQQ